MAGNVNNSNDNRAASRGKNSAFELAITIFFGIISVIFIYPLYNVIIVSVGDRADMASQLVYLFPRKLDLSAYRLIFENNSVVYAFCVSLFVTVVGTSLNMLLTVCSGYALSKKFPGKKLIMNGIILTMFFGGGLIPYYLTIKNLGLVDKLSAMIIPSAINAFYVILMKSYFKTVPAGLEESAKIDGANELCILFKVLVPVSKPTLAAITLFYAVERWNEWYLAMLFITDIKKYPLQYLLREVLTKANFLNQNPAAASQLQTMVSIPPESLKMAIVVIACVPIALVYPFLQKYFTKGIMIGSLKG